MIIEFTMTQRQINNKPAKFITRTLEIPESDIKDLTLAQRHAIVEKEKAEFLADFITIEVKVSNPAQEPQGEANCKQHLSRSRQAT